MEDPQGGLTNTQGSRDAMIAVQAVLHHRRHNHEMGEENVELQVVVRTEDLQRGRTSILGIRKTGNLTMEQAMGLSLIHI